MTRLQETNKFITEMKSHIGEEYTKEKLFLAGRSLIYKIGWQWAAAFSVNYVFPVLHIYKTQDVFLRDGRTFADCFFINQDNILQYVKHRHNQCPHRKKGE